MLSPEQRRGFPPLCPDLVVALASPSEDGARRQPAVLDGGAEIPGLRLELAGIRAA